MQSVSSRHMRRKTLPELTQLICGVAIDIPTIGPAARLKVGRDALDLPIAVADRFPAAAPALFDRQIGGAGIQFGSPGFSLGQGAFRRIGQGAFGFCGFLGYGHPWIPQSQRCKGQLYAIARHSARGPHPGIFPSGTLTDARPAQTAE